MTNEFGDPPAWFSAEQLAIRAELIASAPIGLWLSTDKWGIEVMSTLIARTRSADATPSDFRQLMSMLDRYGLTPKSRTRIMAANARMVKRQRPN